MNLLEKTRHAHRQRRIRRHERRRARAYRHAFSTDEESVLNWKQIGATLFFFAMLIALLVLGFALDPYTAPAAAYVPHAHEQGKTPVDAPAHEYAHRRPPGNP